LIPAPADHLVASLPEPPEIAVNLAVVDELDHDDAVIVELVVAYMARRRAQWMAS
jgi:hypothetical protein